MMSGVEHVMMATGEFERTLPAVTEALPGLLDALAAWLDEHGVLAPPRDDLLLALDEAVSNVIEHGYSDVPGRMTVSAREATGGIELRVADDASPFDPLAAPLPDLDAPLEDRPIGGLGVFLIRQLMDRVEYRREDGQNVLVMSRSRSPERPRA